jgi:hypothetical protein
MSYIYHGDYKDSHVHFVPLILNYEFEMRKNEFLTLTF